MPITIDARFKNAFSDFTSSLSSTPATVDHTEAKNLIDLAKTIDGENSHFFGLIKENTGRKQLEALLNSNPSQFSPAAKSMVSEFTRAGREMDDRLVNNYLRFTSDQDNTPGVVDREEALELIGYANAINRDNQLLLVVPNPVGSEGLDALLTNTPATFTRAATTDISDFIARIPLQTKVLEWKSPKETWHCHWFPMKETSPNGGDPINNLYAPGGVLEKYDTAFDAKSREYELKTNFRAHDSTKSDADWAGHCNNASEVACMLEEPLYPVTFNGVTFSPKDVAGLLVKVSRSLADRVDFEGRRYNGRFADDPSDPKPHVFMEKILKGWGSEASSPKPFVLDIDRKEQVWNYPFDQGMVVNLGGAPKNFPVALLPKGGRISFYEANLRGTTFDEQAQTYQFWIQHDANGNALKSDWIEGAGSSVNPDFAWRPHARGDLSKKDNWIQNTHKQGNPLVYGGNVYEIYVRSIDENYDKVGPKISRWFKNLF